MWPGAGEKEEGGGCALGFCFCVSAVPFTSAGFLI